MTAKSDPNPYLKTKVMTANPGQLRLLLFEGAIKFATKAHQGLLDGNFEAVFEGISRCQQILLELINTLDPKHDPELCERLSGLYTFMYTRLMTAIVERDPAVVEEVLKLLEYERETWTMLLAQLAREQTQLPAAPDQQPVRDPGDPSTDSLVGGNVSRLA